MAKKFVLVKSVLSLTPVAPVDLDAVVSELDCSFGVRTDGASLVEAEVRDFEAHPLGVLVSNRLILSLGRDVELEDVMMDMDCTFLSNLEGVSVVSSEMRDWEDLDV